MVTSLWMVTSKMLAPWKKGYDKPRQVLKSRDITLPTKVCIAKAAVYPVVMYGCESRTLKKESTEELMLLDTSQVLEKTLESPLNSKEIKPVHPKRNQH